MNIVCENWQEALDYFLDPKTVRELKRVRLEVVRMDWKTKTVVLMCPDDDDYARIIAEMSEVATSDKPDERRAVNTTTSSPVFPLFR